MSKTGVNTASLVAYIQKIAGHKGSCDAYITGNTVEIRIVPPAIRFICQRL